jgi:Regulator of ribonuclease activity B
MQFPNDENGDVLRRMLQHGDNLSKSRDIDFAIIFPDENNAQIFGAHFRAIGFEVKIRKKDSRVELPWDVIVVKHMVPNHQEITAFEAELAFVATKYGGRNDGWGCFQQSDCKQTN